MGTLIRHDPRGVHACGSVRASPPMVRRPREASLSPSWRSRLPEPAAGGHFGRPATDRVAGMVVALRRRHPYEVFWMHGRADAIARDTILKGTALSAPMSNLLVQGP